MEWRKVCMDLTMIPLGMLFQIVYHGWLWYMVRAHPHRTSLGIDAVGQQLWISAMLKVGKPNTISIYRYVYLSIYLYIHFLINLPPFM
ncbi:hypothetical protein DsansV1_C13g0120201 [Dioscorea sansibarensis]